MTIRFTIQVTVEDDTTGAPVVHQVARIVRDELKAETLGLTLADGQAILRGLQSVLTTRQISAWQTQQRFCQACGHRRPLKGRHRLVCRTVFGTIALDSDRLRRISRPRVHGPVSWEQPPSSAARSASSR